MHLANLARGSRTLRKAEGEKTGVLWTAGRLLRRSGSDDGKASERRELARTPSFSAKKPRIVLIPDVSRFFIIGEIYDLGRFQGPF